MSYDFCNYFSKCRGTKELCKGTKIYTHRQIEKDGKCHGWYYDYRECVEYDIEEEYEEEDEE